MSSLYKMDLSQPVNLGNGRYYHHRLYHPDVDGSKNYFSGIITSAQGTIPIAVLEHKNPSNFQKEHRILIRLNLLLHNHPNLITFIDNFGLSLLFKKGECDLMHILENSYIHPHSRQFYTLEDRLHFCIDGLNALAAFEGIEWVHLDIKPENFVLCDGHLKLIDFESSCHIDSPINILKHGTPEYVPPEICLCRASRIDVVSKEVLKKWDVWSFGWIALLLSNTTLVSPWFLNIREKKMRYSAIGKMMGNYFQNLQPDALPDPLTVIGRRMAVYNPADRLSAKEALAVVQMEMLSNHYKEHA